MRVFTIAPSAPVASGKYSLGVTCGSAASTDGLEIALWTPYPTRRRLSARVSAFLGYLKEAFPMGTPDELAAYVDR